MSAAHDAERPLWPVKVNGRTLQPVRRDSRAALGPREPVNRITPREGAAHKQALRNDFRTAGKPKGRRYGAPGTISVWAVLVYDALVDFAVSTGRIFPSYAEISERVGCCERTVARALQQLFNIGRLDWERRCVLTPGQGEKGPQVHQTSNFYRIVPFNAARALLERWRRPRPGRTDEADEADRAARDAVRDQYLAIEKADRLATARAALEARSPAIARAGLRSDEARRAAASAAKRE